MSTALNTALPANPVAPGMAGTEQRGTARLRITRRGRRVLLALIALPLVVTALAFALNGGVAVATDTASSTSLQYVTVHSGDSLWNLAETIAPSADPRDVISEIVHLNQLPSTELQAGARLAIPARYSQ